VIIVTERIEVDREPSQLVAQWNPGARLRSRPPAIHQNVVFLHRFQLGTPYPSIAEELARLLDQLPVMEESPALWVDATGVGRPVLEVMRDLGLRPRGVTITGGVDPVVNSFSDVRVPKRQLVGTLQLALQTRRLKIAATLPGLRVLVSELESFKVRVSNTGSETFEAWSAGVHDDTVLALALAVWGGEHPVYRPRLHMI
jgi:hypothetical protein